MYVELDVWFSFISSHLLFRATSAISHVVLGQFKTCVVLLGNYYIFGSNPGATSICGALTAIVGMSCYTYLSICNPKPQTGKLSPGKSSTQSRSSKENVDSHDAYGGESV
jgi:solute carrier family 35 protein E3